MAECNGLKITARYSNSEGPCPGGHQCNNAAWNLYLGKIFIGEINLNNGEDGGDRVSELYATGDEINNYISEFGCNLKFEAKCVNEFCHSNITWYKVETDDGEILLDSCVLDSFELDCCGGEPPPPPPPPTTTRRPTTTTTRRPTTTTSTTTATTTRRPTTTTRTTGVPTTRTTDRCDPSTQRPPIINDPTDAELTTIPSTNSPWDIILIDPSLPLNSDTILTTTTSSTTTSTTTPRPIIIPSTTIQPCEKDCNKLGY